MIEVKGTIRLMSHQLARLESPQSIGIGIENILYTQCIECTPYISSQVTPAYEHMCIVHG